MVAACSPHEMQPVSGGLEAPAPFEALEIPGHTPAVLSLPLGASSRRPVIVATHGAGDRGEWHCELWRNLIGDRAFVLCPQGRRMDERVPHAEAYYYYPDHHALEREVRAALEALARRYPKHVDTHAAIYTGFSQGAIHGALVITLHPELFPRAVLVEGGHGSYQEWSPMSARRYAEGGGERVLFACGGPNCVRSATRSAGYLEKAGVATRVVHAEGAGHSYDAAMEAEIAASLSWVLAGDARFSQ